MLKDVFLEAPALDIKESNIYKYFFCSECDVLVIDKIIDTDIIDYSDSGYYSRKSNRSERLINRIGSIFSYFRKNIVKKYLGLSELKGQIILDIGCGKGGFLIAAREEGAKVYGMEPTVRSFDIAKSKLGEYVMNDSMSISPFTPNSFDIVTMWHVFEHVPSPIKILSDCQFVLKKDGFLIIAVPNYQGLVAKLGGGVWFNLDPPRHVIHYSEKALRKVVESSGFNVLDVNYHYPELTFLSSLQTFLNLLPISKNFLFNYLKRNHAALPESRFIFFKDMMATFIIGILVSPFIIVLTMLTSITRSSDCITLVAKKI